MTAPAAAPSSAPAPIAPPAPRASAQSPANANAFAALLDSLPTAGTKAGESTPKQQSDASDKMQQDQPRRGHSASHSLMSEGALLMSLPFALRAAATAGENEAPAASASASPIAATQAQGLKDDATALSASGTGASVGRLVSERSFHLAASAARFTPGVDLSAGGGVAADLAQTEPMPAKADAAPSSDNTAAPIASLAAGAATNRVSPVRSAPHEAVRSVRKAEASAPQPATREASPAAAVAPSESSGNGKAPDDRARDSGGFTPPSASQTGSLGAQLTASLASPSFATSASTAGAAATPNAAPTASAVTPSAAAQPVKEIDVDLSPSGLEDVSMTMRLAGDKLSVVIRAASSQTLSSIEGARDAIADRLAAIGQPLDSLIVKQTGLNADANTNANAASADDSSTQSGGGRDGSNDASSSRRGAGRDRGF